MPWFKKQWRNSFGWLAERSNAAVLKTVVGATPPGVRIPHHPPVIKSHPLRVCFYYRRMASGSNRNTVALVRQQVDFGSVTHQNRYVCPADTKCRGYLFVSAKNGLSTVLFFYRTFCGIIKKI